MEFYFGLVCSTLLALPSTLSIPTAYPQDSEFKNCGFNLNATCDDHMELFADGKLLATSGDWKNTSVVDIPENTGEIEIRCTDGWILGGILASSENGLMTNNAWNCSSDNGTTWNNAHELGANGVTAEDISPDAKWIWTDRPTWTHTRVKRHTTAICKIQLPTNSVCGTTTTPTPTTTICTDCVPCLFTGTTPTPTQTPTWTPSSTAPQSTPGFNLNATCNDKMELFVDGNLLNTSYNWRDTSQVHIPAATQNIEIHCTDSCWLIEGILASGDNGLLTDDSWNCSSDNGITWSSAHEIVPNGLSVPDISPNAKWISTGPNTWRDGGKVICKVTLDLPVPITTTSIVTTTASPVSTPISKDCLYTDKYVECPDFKNQCKTGNFVVCMNRDCAKTCKCHWSAWSPWSKCSASCGVAVKTRTRKCLQVPCPPERTEEAASCHLPSCGKLWRDDGRCGTSYPLPNGEPGQCDPTGVFPCCSPRGWCGKTDAHCKCSSCVRYTGTTTTPTTKTTTIAAATTKTSSTTITTITNLCPTGWTSLKTGCYRFVSGDFNTANSSCTNERGYLVEINDQEEQDTLKQFYKDSGTNNLVYLGATDQNMEGDWKWIQSGQKVGFTAWAGSEPNGGRKENCVVAVWSRDFKWADVYCHGNWEAICEYEGEGVLSLSSQYVNSLNEDFTASKCLDGDLNTMCVTTNERYPYIMMEYPKEVLVKKVKVVARADKHANRVRQLVVSVTNVKPTRGQLVSGGKTMGTFAGPASPSQEIIFTSEAGLRGKYVVIQQGYTGFINYAEIEITKETPGVLSLSSQYVNIKNEDFTASQCLDGNLNTMCHTTNEKYPFLVMEYPDEVLVKRVKVVARAGKGANRVKQLVVSVTNIKPTHGQLVSGGKILGTFAGPASPAQEIMFTSEAGLRGKYVVIQQGYTGIINYAEIEITKETPGKRQQSSPKVTEKESLKKLKQSERRAFMKLSLPEKLEQETSKISSPPKNTIQGRLNKSSLPGLAEHGNPKSERLEGQTGLQLEFQLKGKTGIEKVKISVDDTEEEFGLTTEWRLFSLPRPSSGSFSVEFLNDIGYTDVFIRGHESQVTDLLPNFPANKFLGCGTTKEDQKCGSLRKGTLMWNGKYTYTLKGQGS